MSYVENTKKINYELMLISNVLDHCKDQISEGDITDLKDLVDRLDRKYKKALKNSK